MVVDLGRDAGKGEQNERQKGFHRESFRIRYIAKAMMARPILIHKGDNTHNHDHAITLQSFKMMNAKSSNVLKPIPLDELLFDIVLQFFVY